MKPGQGPQIIAAAAELAAAAVDARSADAEYRHIELLAPLAGGFTAAGPSTAGGR